MLDVVDLGIQLYIHDTILQPLDRNLTRLDTLIF